jgi:hypothetical protein
MPNWRTVVGVAVLGGVVAAAGPQLTWSWRKMDPAAAPVSRVVVIGLARDVATRRSRYTTGSLRAGVAKLADARDSKSRGVHPPCGFDSLLRHHN